MKRKFTFTLLAAVGAFMFLTASSQAGPGVHFGVFLGGPTYYPRSVYPAYYPPAYGYYDYGYPAYRYGYYHHPYIYHGYRHYHQWR